MILQNHVADCRLKRDAMGQERINGTFWTINWVQKEDILGSLLAIFVFDILKS